VKSARLVLTALSLVSSALSFLSYMLLLRQLGASAQVDALFYAASVPVSAAGLLAAVLLYLLPTRLTELPRAVQEAASRQFIRWVGMATLVALALAASSPLLGGSSHEWLLSSGFVAYAGLSVAGTVLVCRAQAAGQYVLVGMNQFFLVLGLAAGVAAAIALRQVEWVVLGQLMGAAAALMLLTRQLQLPGLLSRRWVADRQELRHTLAPLKPHMLSIVVASTGFTLFQPIDARLCHQLGDGAISIMAFANRAWVAAGLLISLGAHTIAARTTRDAFNLGGAQGLQVAAHREVVRILLTGFVVWLAYLVVGKALLFAVLQAGTMPATELHRLLDCISWMLLSAPAMAAIPYLFRVLYTLGDYRWPAYIGGAIPLLYGAAAWSLLSSLGLAALPLAMGIAWWLALAAVLLVLRHGAGGAAAQKQAGVSPQ
jgi:peptidoglycan biosynthesis protein MviN/MurJ (putative lipid II flippase)